MYIYFIEKNQCNKCNMSICFIGKNHCNRGNMSIYLIGKNHCNKGNMSIYFSGENHFALRAVYSFGGVGGGIPLQRTLFSPSKSTNRAFPFAKKPTLYRAGKPLFALFPLSLSSSPSLPVLKMELCVPSRTLQPLPSLKQGDFFFPPSLSCPYMCFCFVS